MLEAGDLDGYGVGVRTARTIELKKLDLDYFEQDGGA